MTAVGKANVQNSQHIVLGFQIVN